MNKENKGSGNIEELLNMIKNGDFKQRFDAVSRIDPLYLDQAINDKDENVRYKVASRIHADHLRLLISNLIWGGKNIKSKTKATAET